MKRAKLLAVAAVLCQMMFVKLHVIQHKGNDTDTCFLKLKENAKRVRSEVINELKEEIKEEFKSQFKEHELLKKEIAVERARQRVTEEKVDVSYEKIQKLEAALVQCTPITDANTTTATTPTTTTTTTARQKVCTGGFVNFEEHCYILKLEEVKWDAAVDRCRELGADLVSINTEAENNFLVEKIKEYYPPGEKKIGNFWIGMLYEGGKYVWPDGTRVGFTDWRSDNEPNCMDHVCSALISTYESVYKWEDATWSYDFHYICEKYVTYI
ncbi:C-type lectin domain family 4 member M-like [Haliotis asinina]|uniref:C-type lectin domain family 4 member M-like n=1 Tax=Haliotis asinina TaxID=109174 RepID=UPI003531AFB2